MLPIVLCLVCVSSTLASQFATKVYSGQQLPTYFTPVGYLGQLWIHPVRDATPSLVDLAMAACIAECRMPPLSIQFDFYETVSSVFALMWRHHFGHNIRERNKVITNLRSFLSGVGFGQTEPLSDYLEHPILALVKARLHEQIESEKTNQLDWLAVAGLAQASPRVAKRISRWTCLYLVTQKELLFRRQHFSCKKWGALLDYAYTIDCPEYGALNAAALQTLEHFKPIILGNIAVDNRSRNVFTYLQELGLIDVHLQGIDRLPSIAVSPYAAMAPRLFAILGPKSMDVERCDIFESISILLGTISHRLSPVIQQRTFLWLRVLCIGQMPVMRQPIIRGLLFAFLHPDYREATLEVIGLLDREFNLDLLELFTPEKGLIIVENQKFKVDAHGNEYLIATRPYDVVPSNIFKIGSLKDVKREDAESMLESIVAAFGTMSHRERSRLLNIMGISLPFPNSLTVDFTETSIFIVTLHQDLSTFYVSFPVRATTLEYREHFEWLLYLSSLKARQ